MVELLLCASFLLSTFGMAFLALAMKVHWYQARAAVPYTPDGARRLRIVGALSLALSLSAALGADHGSIAALVWVMTVSMAAVLVALILAYRPRWLECLARVAS